MTEKSGPQDSELIRLEIAKENLQENNLFFNKPEENIENVRIKIFKANRRLELYGNGEIIGRFKIALGSNPVGDKEKEGDRKTPEGEYYVCTRNDKSKYTLSLGVSYPNVNDAKEGLEKGIIDDSTFNDISDAINSKKRPPWKTSLGGEIMIHGGGNSTDWTWGCIALSDEDIRILWDYASMGTPISVYQ
ncbi:L,D-transpeptidase family protein [Clostridium sediminicola]|uniref:L,D-transpeptidase family protein n=1 Tax=Clostridium sediminicola TaxID=3114879 RepID=UPI003D17B419